MKGSPLLFTALLSFSILGCGLKKKAPIVSEMEKPTPRSSESIALESLKSQYKTEGALFEQPYYRARGVVQVEMPDMQQKAKLDIRIRANETNPIVWLDVADPFVGFKLARGMADREEIQGYAHIINKSFSEPIAGIPLETLDMVNLLTGKPLALPESVVGMNLTTYSDGIVAYWKIQFPVKRGGHEGTLLLALTKSSPHRLLSQEISIPTAGYQARVEYKISGGWSMSLKGPDLNGELDFDPSSVNWQDESLSFPFNLPSGYARIRF